MRRPPLLLVLLLAACAAEEARRPPSLSATPAAISPRSAGAVETVVPLAPAEVIARAQAALEARGFTPLGPVSPGRMLEMRSGAVVDAGWASCPRLVTRDPFAEALRTRAVDASEVRSTVTVLARADAGGAGSAVVVRASHVGTYLNSFTNTPEEAPCRTTAALEEAVLDAIRAGG
jgi:hypothetical protein